MDDCKTSRRYFVETWGCQMNVFDSERAAGLMQASGYEPATTAEEADVVLFMTCSVREKAAVKVLHALSRIRGKWRPREGRLVAVLGCVAEQEGEALLKGARAADIVLGPRRLQELPELLATARAGTPPRAEIGVPEEPGYVEGPVARSPGTQARITIMEGCQLRCTFCVVPMTRGPEICRPPGEIVAEARGLLACGFKELLLLGQTVNAYRAGETSFGALLEQLTSLDGEFRIKFVSSHPLFFQEELVSAMARSRKVVPWANLPLQSGSDRVLKRMRRRYDAAGYLATVERLRRAMPNIGLNTDIIVGFPGETEEDFVATLRLVERVGFDSLYAFKYSERPGTPAARLGDDVPDQVKAERLHRLLERQGELQRERLEGMVGSVVPVLIDSVHRGRPRGRTPEQRIVEVSSDVAPGSLLAVRITGHGTHGLAGEPVALG